MFNWFRKKDTATGTPLFVDVHSHLLAAIDDGVRTLDEAEAIILEFSKVGYTRMITTPHVMSDTYRNTREGILEKLEELRNHLKSRGIDFQVDAAAEYYLDEELMGMLERNEPLLTFGKKYLLFETNFLNEPLNLKEFIFLATTRGYKPVMAHPERYHYLDNNFAKAEDLLNRGVLFQINIGSIAGAYSKSVQRMANQFIDRKWVHLLGSDCHHIQHAAMMESAQRMKYFQKALTLPLLNNAL